MKGLSVNVKSVVKKRKYRIDVAVKFEELKTICDKKEKSLEEKSTIKTYVKDHEKDVSDVELKI